MSSPNSQYVPSQLPHLDGEETSNEIEPLSIGSALGSNPFPASGLGSGLEVDGVAMNLAELPRGEFGEMG